MNPAVARATSGWAYPLAGLLTAAVSMAVSYAVPQVARDGDCSEGSVYFCLWFITILYSAPVTCVFLSVLLLAGLFRSRSFGLRWLLVVLCSIAFTQLLVSGAGILLAEPRTLYGFLTEAALFPYGAVAGAVVGALYMPALMLISRR